MKLRTATLHDLELLCYWDTKPHVIECGGASDSVEWEKELQIGEDWQEILIAEVDDRPIGVIIICDPHVEPTHYWGEVEPNLRAIDIWIGEESDLGKGYGTQMMGLALERCFAPEEVEAVLLDPLVSNKDACRFYERLGFVQVERRFFDQDDCYVYRYERPVR